MNIPAAPASLFTLVTQLDALCQDLGLVHGFTTMAPTALDNGRFNRGSITFFGDVNDTVMIEVYQHPELDAAMKQIKDIPETDVFLSSNRINIPTAPAWLFSLVTQLDTL